MSQISVKYIPIHIHNFEHSRVIMNMKLSSHGFLFHRNLNRKENKAQIPLIIHHNEKKQRIYLYNIWCVWYTYMIFEYCDEWGGAESCGKGARPLE